MEAKVKFVVVGVFVLVLTTAMIAGLLWLSSGKYYRKSYDVYATYMTEGSKTVYEVGVDLATLRDPEAVAAALGIVLGEDPAPFYEAMTNPPEDVRYLVLRDFVGAEAAKQLNQLIQSARAMAEPGRAGRLQGIALNAHPQREYPEGALGSNVVGFVSYEGRGYFGVEEK